MSNNFNSYYLVFVIVKCGLGSKVTKYAKSLGSKGSTVFIGKGTLSNPILRALELSDVRREIVLLLVDKDTKANIESNLSNKFKIEKSNNGIIFSIPVSGIIGASTCTHCTQWVNDNENTLKGDDIMHKAILTIVDKGIAQDVIDSAKDAGARGGTIINARGSGIHETAKLFAMDIEPEKEVVLIITDDNIADKVVAKIKLDLSLEDPGKGIMVVLPVDNAIGLH